MGQTIAKPENQELTLTGVIREVHGYGPPGYGEDKKRDSHITYWALELPRPINLPCTPEKPEWAPTECVSERQPHLFFAESPTGGDLELKAKSLKDSRALVTGVLHRADTAGEITAIYMDVTEATEVLRRDNPAVAPPDKSDSFERNGNGEKFRVQHRELAGTNFRVAGVDLAANEEVLTQAARIFGKVPTVVTGDASTANERACYRSVEMNNAAYLLFESRRGQPFVHSHFQRHRFESEASLPAHQQNCAQYDNRGRPAPRSNTGSGYRSSWAADDSPPERPSSPGGDGLRT